MVELCLDLQDRHGADVNVILLALWCGQASIRLSPQALECVIKNGPRDWHEAVVRRLRAARRAMKSPPAYIGPEMVEPVRQRLKAVEIECEKLEQRLLFEALARVRAGDTGELGAEQPQAVAAENMRNYLTCLSVAGSTGITDTVDRAVRLCID